MVALTRNPASCGGQILTGLADINPFAGGTRRQAQLDALRTLLAAGLAYQTHSQREVNPDLQKIYIGETIMFSDTTGPLRGGEILSRLIRNHGLGIITSTGQTRNPNTGHAIDTWLWLYNGRGLPENVNDLLLETGAPARPLPHPQVPDPIDVEQREIQQRAAEAPPAPPRTAPAAPRRVFGGPQRQVVGVNIFNF